MTTSAQTPLSIDRPTTWPLERILFAMAGTVTLLSAVLAAFVSPWFLLLTAFVGINQWFFVTVHNCPASLVLRRFGRQPQCRW
jgi:fatty acid desaturase